MYEDITWNLGQPNQAQVSQDAKRLEVASKLKILREKNEALPQIFISHPKYTPNSGLSNSTITDGNDISMDSDVLWIQNSPNGPKTLSNDLTAL